MGNPIANAQGDNLLYGGSSDPRANPIDVPKNAIYIWAPEVGLGAFLRKLDDGVTTNYEDITPSGFIPKTDNTVFVLDNGEYADLQEAIDAAPDNSTFVIGAKDGGWGDIVLPQKNLSFFGVVGARPELAAIGKVTCPTGVDPTVAVFTNLLFNQPAAENVVEVSGTGQYQLRFNECRMLRPAGGTKTMISADNANIDSSLYFYDCRIRTFNSEFGGRIVDTNCQRVIFSRCELIGANKSLYYDGVGRVDAAFTLFQVESTQSAVEMVQGTLVAPVTTFYNGRNNGSGLELGAGAVAILQSASFNVNPGNGFAIHGSGTILSGIIDFNNVAGVNPKNTAIENTINQFNSTVNVMRPDFSNSIAASKDLDFGGFKAVNLANPTNNQDAVTLDYFNSNLPSPGNLWSDPVNNNILTDASDQRNLGSQTNQFKALHNESVFLYQGGSPNLSAAVDNSGATFNIYSNAKPIIIQSRVTSSFSSDIALNTEGASSLSGSINIQTGGSGAQSGSILLAVGSALNQGSITFQDGSEGTIGHVWTSKGVNGEGEWSAPAAGGDLWSDPVNSNILPDASETRNLGSLSNQFNQIHLQSSKYYRSGSPNLSGELDNAGTSFALRSIEKELRLESSTSSTIAPNIFIVTGGASNTSGSLFLRTGGAGQQSGPIDISTGPSGTRGNITISGNQVDFTGSSSINFTGVNIIGLTAGDLWSDPVDANIIPDSSANNRTLGDATSTFLDAHSRAYSVYSGANLIGTISAGTSLNIVGEGNSGGIGRGVNIQGSSSNQGGGITIFSGDGNAASGNIDIATGTAVGLRGLISFDARLIEYNYSPNQNHVWESGVTGSRPATPVVATTYFDTDLGIPVWYDGTNWVDATGATV